MDGKAATGWAKVPQAAEYAGLKPRTFRELLKQGLPHARLSSGTILIKITDIDEYLSKFSQRNNEAEKIARELFNG